jgi:tungstate transport system substrate-binding protein
MAADPPDGPPPGGVARAGEVVLASTVAPVESGIVAALVEAFRTRTGIPVRVLAMGTGLALATAGRGAADLVLVHALSLERLFLASELGIDRRDVMYNDFVILGPHSDPAGLGGLADPTEAFRRIAAAGAGFVSRGDRSGTHLAELALWAAAGLAPGGAGYEVFAQGDRGNGATLLHADGRGAYVLMDRATWLVRPPGLSLALLVEGHPDLFNFIAVIRANPARLSGLNAAGALALADWLVGDEAQALIADFGRDAYGAPLFFANAGPRIWPPLP